MNHLYLSDVLFGERIPSATRIFEYVSGLYQTINLNEFNVVSLGISRLSYLQAGKSTRTTKRLPPNYSRLVLGLTVQLVGEMTAIRPESTKSIRLLNVEKSLIY